MLHTPGICLSDIQRHYEKFLKSRVVSQGTICKHQGHVVCLDTTEVTYCSVHSLLFDCFLPNLTGGYDVEDNGLLLFTLYLTGGKIELHIDILSLPLFLSLTH